METIWIIGSGKFGIGAAKGMTDQSSARRITLVDQDEAALYRAKGFGCEIVAAEGIAFLTRHLKANTGPDWVVPAVPVHLAWEWCLNELFKKLSVETFSSLVIKSHQLGPGVGGYKPESLFALKNDLEQARGGVLVGTSCKCHGVISAGIVRS